MLHLINKRLYSVYIILVASLLFSVNNVCFGLDTYGDVQYGVNSDGTATFIQGGNIININAAGTNSIIAALQDGTLTTDALVTTVISVSTNATTLMNGASSVTQTGIGVGQGTPGHEIIDSHLSNTSVGMACANGSTIEVSKIETPTTETPPPTPIVTTSSSTTSGGACSSYIAYWGPSWSTCSINSNWSPSGTITCLQTNPWTPISQSCGTLLTTVVTTCTDGVCVAGPASSSCNASSCPGNAPRPTPTTDIKTITMDLTHPSTTYNNAYANDYDSNSVTVNISGSTNQNRAIVGWGANGVFSSFTEPSPYISSNRIDGGGRALNFSDITSQNINGGGTAFNFKITPIKSRSPFVGGGGKIAFKAGATSLILNNVNYNFKKPFIGYIRTSEDNGATWSGKTQVGTELLYRLGLAKRSTLTWTGLLNYTLNDFTNVIQPFGNGLEIQAKNVITSTLVDTTGTQFKARLNTSANATTLNKTPGLQINLPIITYKLGGETIKYYLSNGDSGDDVSPVNTSGDEFLGVRVVGGIQGAGKSEFTGQKANISNIATSEMRATLRKNAYTFTRSMKDGEVIDGVRYEIGDVTISGDPILNGKTYETLVVKDGNVIIDNDLNISDKKFGIMVLKDGYDSNNGFNGKGNIYIKPNVAKINAVIYADGAMISVDSAGNPYTTDSITRTYALGNQLVMNGSIFTRNTIGGAIIAGGKYILPGGATLSNTTANFNMAMQYDLNYIRRGKSGCDKNSGGTCIYNEPFIIKYNTKFQSAPPKLFSN